MFQEVINNLCQSHPVQQWSLGLGKVIEFSRNDRETLMLRKGTREMKFKPVLHAHALTHTHTHKNTSEIRVCECVCMSFVCAQFVSLLRRIVVSVPWWMKFITFKWTQCMKGTYKSVLFTHRNTHCPFLYLPLYYCVLQQHLQFKQEIKQALKAAHLHSLLIVWGKKNMGYGHETIVNELLKNYVLRKRRRIKFYFLFLKTCRISVCVHLMVARNVYRSLWFQAVLLMR